MAKGDKRLREGRSGLRFRGSRQRSPPPTPSAEPELEEERAPPSPSAEPEPELEKETGPAAPVKESPPLPAPAPVAPTVEKTTGTWHRVFRWYGIAGSMLLLILSLLHEQFGGSVSEESLLVFLVLAPAVALAIYGGLRLLRACMCCRCHCCCCCCCRRPPPAPM